jgi:hypothetical protein
VFFGLGTIETGDGNRLNRRGIDQVPVVKELVYNFTGLMNFYLTEFLDSLEVLSVERSKAGGVKI